MRKFIVIILLLTVWVLLTPLTGTVTFENNSKTRYAKDHFIIKLKKNDPVLAAAGSSVLLSDVKIIENFASRVNLNVSKIKKLFPEDKNNNTRLAAKYELDMYYAVYFSGLRDISGLCKESEKDMNIEFAEPDYIGECAGEPEGDEPLFKPNDEFYNRQWGLKNDGSIRSTTGKPGKVGADMNVERGWDVERGNEEVIVAILDSGAKLDHPELTGRIWTNPKEVRNGLDDDGNGYVDDLYGWNFAYDTWNVKDDGGHGTNICGTIGCNTDNDLGYAGIDQKCKLMICKNLDDENLGEYSWWSSSLYYAANNGARVINMSEGGYDYSRTLHSAINYAYDAGCLIVASMMNKNNSDNYYPASFINVMAIGATDTDDGRCRQFTWGGGSNWGKHIAVVAPGNRIYGLDYKDNYNYEVYWSGTSQATAYVSGISALLLAQDRTRTNKEVHDIITSTAQDMVGDPREDKPGWDEFYGFGRVDLYSALTFGLTPVRRERQNINENNGQNTGNNDQQNEHQARSVERKSDNKTKDDDPNRAKKPQPDKR